LERQGIVRAQERGRWSVPTDLLEQLEQRHRAAPERYHVSVQPLAQSLDRQVAHRGPVWLDTLDETALSRRGFGADVRTALEKRRGLLRELGVDHCDPHHGAKRQELARRGAGEKLAQETGQMFSPTIPRGFRGTVRPGPQGSPYLAISDKTRFVLVPKAPETQRLLGKTVDVLGDLHGRFVGLRPAGLDRGRGR
jgi:hypothetical protein